MSVANHAACNSSKRFKNLLDMLLHCPSIPFVKMIIIIFYVIIHFFNVFNKIGQLTVMCKMPNQIKFNLRQSQQPIKKFMQFFFYITRQICQFVIFFIPFVIFH